jgi:hypothetical protein
MACPVSLEIGTNVSLKCLNYQIPRAMNFKIIMILTYYIFGAEIALPGITGPMPLYPTVPCRRSL